MIGAFLMFAALTAGVLPQKEAKKLAAFEGHVRHFAATKKLSQEIVVALENSSKPEDLDNWAWVHCERDTCRVSVSQRYFRKFSGNILEYLAAHEICHVAHGDANVELWTLITPEERDQRHLYVDVCVMDLIGTSGLGNYLFDCGWNDVQIDRYIRKVRWFTYQSATPSPSRK